MNYQVRNYLLYRENQPQPIISYHVFKLLTQTLVTNIHQKSPAVLKDGNFAPPC